MKNKLIEEEKRNGTGNNPRLDDTRKECLKLHHNGAIGTTIQTERHYWQLFGSGMLHGASTPGYSFEKPIVGELFDERNGNPGRRYFEELRPLMSR